MRRPTTSALCVLSLALFCFAYFASSILAWFGEIDSAPSMMSLVIARIIIMITIASKTDTRSEDFFDSAPMAVVRQGEALGTGGRMSGASTGQRRPQTTA
jgi:hypothetical protein